MDWVMGMQRAIDYVEAHITEELDYSEIARQSYSTAYHFQRVFGLLCGYTLGEYIRSRRLTLAGGELAGSGAKVVDVALKYGYDNPDSFARAFTRFHGVTPSQARREGVKLNSFSRLSLKLSLEGGSIMEYRIEEKQELLLTGYKRRFTGVPHVTKEFDNQTGDFYVHTRANQFLLRGMSTDDSVETHYSVVTNVADDGYDFYIAEHLTDWYHEHMAEDIVLGAEAARFEDIKIPAGTYAVFETERCAYPTTKNVELRKRIAAEWLPSSDYILADRPELLVIHWFRAERRDERYIELWVPVEKRQAGFVPQ